MGLTWELDDLAHAATPRVAHEARVLLPHVVDILDHDDGRTEAIVRDESAEIVVLSRESPLRDVSCTCGQAVRRAPCAHALAVQLRRLQQSTDFGERRLESWLRRVEALGALRASWEGFANLWLECQDAGVPYPVGAVLEDVGSLRSGLQVARALVGRASEVQLSEFLVALAAESGIDGASALGSSGILDAEQLVMELWNPLDDAAPGVSVAALCAAMGSLQRTAKEPRENWRIESALGFACTVLGALVADGHADARQIASVALDAEISAPGTSYPGIGVMMHRFGRGAAAVAREMTMLLERAKPAASGLSPERAGRLRAELALAAGDHSELVSCLERWPEAPFGEFLHRLSPLVPLRPRLDLLMAARRAGRLRWAPGWPHHVPDLGGVPRIHQVHDVLPGHPAWRDIAVGDLVTALVLFDQIEEARVVLEDHARAHPEPSHRHEYLRVWSAAGLEEGAEDAAHVLFGYEDDGMGRFLEAISAIPEQYFCLDLDEARVNIGAALLTAVLLEDEPAGEPTPKLAASTWTTLFPSTCPRAVDGLAALATIPDGDFRAVLGSSGPSDAMGLRAKRIASYLLRDARPVPRMADIDASDIDHLLETVRAAPQGGPVTAGLLGLLLGGRSAVGESLLAEAVRPVLDREPQNIWAMLQAAFATEPRGVDLASYHVGLVLWSQVDRQRARHRRSRWGT